MDTRWRPVNQDSKRDIRVYLHPTAAIWEIRSGLYDSGSNDAIDLSPYVSGGTQTAFDCKVTLKFNRELFGDSQPQPGQILEVQFFQDDQWQPIWLGTVDAITSFTLQRGERSMQLIAKTRDSQDIWRYTKRTTELFPQMTNLTHIATRVARSAGLRGDEIALPPSTVMTAHSNTQLADMNAWDMLQQVFLPLGWTPFIDVLGRLRAANRNLQGREADVILADERLVKVGGQRQRPPKSRVRLLWLNPTLKRHVRQGQKLTEIVVTIGWFLPYWQKTFYFSDDRTLRAEKTYRRPNPSVNSFAITAFVTENYVQQTENQGKLWFVNFNFALMVGIILKWYLAHHKPDIAPAGGGPVTPVGRREEAIYQVAFCLALMNMGTGVYEIWGNPFDWVHARNTSIAFNTRVPIWVDNGLDIESDFIADENHAKVVCVRELIYNARSANKWSVTLVDDPRIEFGDLLQFTDGNQIYVEDFSRSLERGSAATLEVTGFLNKPFAKVAPADPVVLTPGDPTDGLPPGIIFPQPPVVDPNPPPTGGPGEPPGTPPPGGSTPQVPFQDMLGDVREYFAAHPTEVANSCQTGGGNWDLMHGLVPFLQGRSNGRIGYNGKRGTSERSLDAVAYWYGDLPPVEGGRSVYIIDCIGGHCGPNPEAAWNNVTAAAPGAWYSTAP